MSGGGVCRFFLQGNCKFGDRCRFQHTRSNESQLSGQQQQYGSQSFTQNRYSLFNKTNTQSSTPTSNNETLKSITSEMETWGNSKMWPFSCYAHTKESTCMPGFDDFSPEEMRLEAYNENRNHAAQVNYKSKEAQLGQEYKSRREKLRNPDATTKQNMLKFFDDAKKGTATTSSAKGQLFSTNSAFGGTTSSASTGNVFGVAKTSGFGAAKQTSAFGGTSTTNLFGKGPSMSSTSVEAIDMSQSAFGASPSQNSLFKPATFGAASAFGGSAATETKSAFGGSMTPQTSTSTFGASAFGKTTFGATPSTGFGASGASAFGASATSPSTGFGAAVTPSAFGSTTPQASAFGTTAGQSSAFGSATNQTSVIGQTSAFGAAQTNQTSAFGGATGSQPTAFGGATASAGQPSAFGAGVAQASAFGSTTQASAFGGTTSTTQGFGASLSTFGAKPTTLFGKPVQVSSAAAGAAGVTVGTTSNQQLYTALDHITPQEKAEFESQTFTLGNIPTRPPPKEYV